MEGFRQWFLTEMPINMHHLGNWQYQKALPFVTSPEDKKKIARFKDHGWKWDDFQMLTSDAALQKIARKCSRVHVDIEAYFLRTVP